MQSTLVKQLEENLVRLLRLQGSDAGFYVLAVHSFIENHLRLVIVSENFDDDSFYFYIDSFRELLRSKKQGFIPGLDVLGMIIKQHKITNEVRHRFGMVDSEEARAATHNLRRFWDLADLPGLKELSKLEEYLSLWEEKRSLKEVKDELSSLCFKLHIAQNDVKQLTEQVEQLETLRAEMVHVSTEKRFLEHRIKQLELVKGDRDDKIDDLRAQRRQLLNEQSRISKELEEYKNVQEYIDSLSRLTVYTRSRFDFERSITRLTKEQQTIIDQISLGADFLIKGSAGTGKTLVLIKAIEKARKSDQESLGMEEPAAVALLTYTNALVKYDRYIAELISGNNPADRVSTADSFLLEKLQMIDSQYGVDFNLPRKLAENYPVEELSVIELAAEVEQFIFGNDISYEEYVEEGIERKNMKRPLSKEIRKKVWTSLTQMVADMEQRKRFTKNYSRLKIAQYATERYGDPGIHSIDYAFIDEAQDLSTADIKAIKACTKRCIVMAGDADQSIYQPGFSFTRGGVDIRGRTRILKINFRNTMELHEFCEGYRKKIPGQDMESQPEAFRNGPPPELFLSDSRDELLDLIGKRVGLFINQIGYDPENICILSPLRTDMSEVSNRITRNGYTVVNIKDKEFDFSQTPGIRKSTMHSCKGLDFPVILLYLPGIITHDDTYDTETADKMVRNLIYVALSRAMDHLNIFTIENSGVKAIDDLIDTFRETVSLRNSHD